MLVLEHLLHLTVSARDTINFLLEHLALIRLLLHRSFHFVDFDLALTDVLFDLLHFLFKVCNGVLLQNYFTFTILDFVLIAREHQALSLASILRCISGLNMHLLVLAIHELQLQQLVSLLSVKLFSLFEMGNLDEQLLLVHLSLHLVEHGDRNVINHLQLLVYLR